MTRDELQYWIDNNKNIKKSRYYELSNDFADRLMIGFTWVKSSNMPSEWMKIYRKHKYSVRPISETEPPIIFLLENNHTTLEIAAIELTLMFSWEESDEGFRYWNRVCLALLAESNLK